MDSSDHTNCLVVYTSSHYLIKKRDFIKSLIFDLRRTKTPFLFLSKLACNHAALSPVAVEHQFGLPPLLTSGSFFQEARTKQACNQVTLLHYSCRNGMSLQKFLKGNMFIPVKWPSFSSRLKRMKHRICRWDQPILMVPPEVSGAFLGGHL